MRGGGEATSQRYLAIQLENLEVEGIARAHPKDRRSRNTKAQGRQVEATEENRQSQIET